MRSAGFLLLPGLLLAECLPAASAAGLPLLTEVAQIRGLSLRAAARGYPVHIRAVVTYYAPPTRDPSTPGGVNDPDLFIADSTAGIWVRASAADARVRAGQVLELDGATEAGFAPEIGRAHYRVVGEAPLPAARRVSFARMLSTAEDAQWVEIDGIVRRVENSAGLLQLDTAVAGGRLRVFMPIEMAASTPDLVDAEVRFRGACGATFNRNNQLIGVMLYVPNLRHVQVLRAPPRDPFTVPMERIESLQQFAPARSVGHRVRVAGAVTFQDAQSGIYIYDGSKGIRVESAAAAGFGPGDRIEVAGFPRVSDYGLVLEDALCRRTGSRARITAHAVTAQQILAGDYDSLPVSLEGRLIESSLSTHGTTLLFQSGPHILDASLAGNTGPLPRPEARVRLTGICQTTKNVNGDTTAFRLLLGGPDSVRVIRNAPWWTLGRALGALTVLWVAVLAAMAWAVSLRRRVRRHVEQIRQRLEKEAQLEQRFDRLLDNAHDIIFTADGAGVLTSINRAGEKISGHTREELLDRRLETVFRAQDGAIAEAIACVSRDQNYAARDWAIAAKDGGFTQVEVTLQAITEGGAPCAVLGIARDISDRQRMEQALLRARQLAGDRDAAQEASRAKSVFLAHMSHELRTPLNAIIGYSQMLQEDDFGPGREEVREDLAKIEQSGQMLLGIINDVLDLSKIEAGRETVRAQVFDLKEVLRDVAGALQPLAQQQATVLTYECPEPARMAYGDVSKFRQSLLNLVNNALKFTERGSVKVTVDRTRRRDGEWTEVEVADTGIGIGREHLGKLFQPFSQVDGSATRKYNGTGLGLAISKKFCQMMGGDITVESEPGQGSRFTIRLPAVREKARSSDDSKVHPGGGR